MANEFKVKKGLIVDGSNTVLDVQGTQGQLFSVTDSLAGDLFSVSDVSGIPILNVNSSGAISFDGYVPDNNKLKFGNSGDLEIYHDGSHSRIKDAGVGHLTINATDFVVNNSADTKNMIIATDGGSVNLYYNASQKFRTVSAGAEVTGTLSILSGGITAPGLVYDSSNKYLSISHWASPPTPAAMLHLSDNSNDLGTPQIRIEGRENPGDTVLDIAVKDADVRFNLVEGTTDASSGYGKMHFKTNANANSSHPTRGGFLFQTGAGSVIDALTITNEGNATFAEKVDIRGSGYHQIHIAHTTSADTNKQSGITTSNYEGNNVSIFQTFQQNNSNAIYYGSADGSHRGVQKHYFMVNTDSDATTGHTQALRIESDKSAIFSGQVGVGTAPTTQLQVRGAVTTLGDARYNLRLDDATTMAAGVGAGIVFGGQYITNNTTPTNFAAIWSKKENATSGEFGGELHLGTRVNSGNISSDLIIDSAGDATFAGKIITESTATGAITLNGGTGVSTTGSFVLRQNGDSDGNGMAITSSYSTSHRIWKDANGVLNIGSSSNTNAFQQDVAGNVTIEGTLDVTASEIELGGNWVIRGTDGTYHQRIKTIDSSSTSAVDTFSFDVKLGSDASWKSLLVLDQHDEARFSGDVKINKSLLVGQAGGASGIGNLTLFSRYSVAAPYISFKTDHPNQSTVWETGRIDSTDSGNYNGKMLFKVATGSGSASGGASMGTVLTLDDDSSARFEGKIGIGTSPTTLLHLNGTGDAIRVESTNAGSAGAQIDLLHFTASPADSDITGLINFGGYYSGSNSAYSSSIRSVWTDVSEQHGQLEFWTRDDSDWARRLTINHEGDVGVGDGAPSSISANTFNLSVNSGRNDLSGALINKSNGTIKHQQYWDSSGYGFYLSGNSGDFKWRVNNKDRMVIDKDGGIDLQGTVGQLFSVTNSLSGDLFSVADISGIPILNINSSGAITFDGYVPYGNKLNFGSIGSGLEIYSDSGSNSYIKETGGSGSLVFNSNEFYFQDNATNTRVKFVNGGGIALYRDTDPYIQFFEGTTNRGDIFIDTSANHMTVRGASGHGVKILANGASDNATTGITLDTSNNVTIGGNLYLPQYIYHSGDTNTNINLESSQITIATSGGSHIQINNDENIYFRTNGTNRFKMDTGGTFTATADIVAYGSVSDKSYKENIKPITGALNLVDKLQGVTFDWKEDTDTSKMVGIKEDIGFIAQDVQEVLPELVRENDNGKLSLRDKGIVPVLVEAIKELKAEIEELKSNKCNCNK